MRRLAALLLLLLFAKDTRAAAPIRLVVIDRATTMAYGPLPWGRDRHAQLVSWLDHAGARAIVLRFYFRDPHDVNGDAALVAAVKKSGKVFIELGKAEVQAGWDPPDAWLKAAAVTMRGIPPKKIFSSDHVEVPYDALAHVVRGVGSIDVMVNREKKLEGLPLLVKYRGHLIPSLGFRVFSFVAGREAAVLAFEQTTTRHLGLINTSETRYLRVDEKRIAIDAYGCAPVNLTAPGSGYATFSLVDVLKDKVSAAKFKDAVVIVGAETPELDVDTSTGAKSGLELVADQLAALFQYAGDTTP